MTSPKKKKFTITASEPGVETAEKALLRLGFESKSNFARSQLISRSVVTKFFNYQPVQLDTFKRICEGLKLNWRDIAGLEEEQQRQGKKTDCSSLKIQKEVEQVQTLSRSVTVVDESTQTVKVEITLKGDIYSVDNLKTLEFILRQYSGDTIKITDIQEGSIKLSIEGSQDDINKLLERIQSGELTEVDGFPIEDIKILSESSDNEESKESVDKWSLVEEIMSQSAKKQDLSGVDLSDEIEQRFEIETGHVENTSKPRRVQYKFQIPSALLEQGYIIDRFEVVESFRVGNCSLNYKINNNILELKAVARAVKHSSGLWYTKGGCLKATVIVTLKKSEKSTFTNDIDLSGVDLSGVDLSGVDLSRANLSGANLSETDLSGANLSRANLSGADLSESQVTNTRFSSDSLGMTEELKQDLIQRRAIFEDSLQSEDFVPLSATHRRIKGEFTPDKWVHKYFGKTHPNLNELTV